MAVVIAVLVVLALGVLQVCSTRWVWRHNREKFAAHPEKRPYGTKLMWRALPFAGLCAAFAVWGGFRHDYWWVALGVIGVACFAVDLHQRWEPAPDTREALEHADR